MCSGVSSTGNTGSVLTTNGTTNTSAADKTETVTYPPELQKFMQDLGIGQS